MSLAPIGAFQRLDECRVPMAALADERAHVTASICVEPDVANAPRARASY
jgi:hypothetical protein